MTDLFQTSGTSPTDRTNPEPDFVVQDHGSIFLLRALTPAVSAWIEENLSEDRQTFGDAVAVEAGFILPVVIGAQRDGLTVMR